MSAILGSMRARLTVGLAALILLGLGAFAVYAYVAVTTTLTADLDQTLRLQAEQIAATSDFVAPEFPGTVAPRPAELGVVAHVAEAGIVVESFDPQGRVTERSDTLGPQQLVTSAEALALTMRPPHLYTRSLVGDPLRVYSLPVRRGGRLIGLVVVAAPLRHITMATRTVLALLVVGGLGMAALTVLASSLLVRRGLRPLEEMARVAEGITARRFERRLQLRHPPREIERLAHTFDAMLDRLHGAFAGQRRFVADAAHELRTPLMTIRGRGDVLLLDSALDSRTRAGLTLMRDEAGRMGRLVANLLLLARGDDGRAIDRRPVELDALLLEVAQHAHTLAQGVTVAIGHEDQAVVWGDADLLKQLALNLVDNALTYTPAGGHVELSLFVADGWARLSVRDSGPGIAAEDLERIFERFYRVDRARSRHTGGGGLGLAIARWIAEAHGGRIEVDSALGRGSAFTLVVPLSHETIAIL